MPFRFVCTAVHMKSKPLLNESNTTTSSTRAKDTRQSGRRCSSFSVRTTAVSSST